MELYAKVLTVSDTVAKGGVADASGDALAAALAAAGFTVVQRMVTPDGVVPVSEAISELASGFTGVVVTTGGTGFGPRDLTPEATEQVLDRRAPGLAEAMRAVSPKGRLSRGVAGTIGPCLVLNTPGSPAGAVESLGGVVDVLPHAVALLAGEHPHPHGAGNSHSEPSQPSQPSRP